MATPPMAMPPPPGSGPGAGAPPPNPTAPTAVSPAPPTPSPQMEQGTQLLIQVVQGLRTIAQSFPSTAPKVAEINNLMRELVPLMMQAQQTGEPMAPPNG